MNEKSKLPFRNDDELESKKEWLIHTITNNNTENQQWWGLGSGGLAVCTVADGSEDILTAG